MKQRPAHQGTPGKVYHLWLNQLFECWASDCTLSAVRGKWDGPSSDGYSSSCFGGGIFVLLLFGSAFFGGSVRFQGLYIKEACYHLDDGTESSPALPLVLEALPFLDCGDRMAEECVGRNTADTLSERPTLSCPTRPANARDERTL